MQDVEIVELDEQTTAVVRALVPVEKLATFFGRAFGTVYQALAAQGIEPVGPPFGFYPSMPGDTVEVEAGFPVPEGARPAGEVLISSLPGGRVVHTLHVGPYDTMGSTYEALQAWMTGEGLTPAVGMWEVYLSDPEAQPDPATWQTGIYWPLVDGDDTA